MRSPSRMLLSSAALTLSIGLCLAQFRGGGRRFRGGEDNSGPFVRTEGGELVNEDTVRTARETAPHSVDLPEWTNPPAFDQDVFTFTRVLYKSVPGRRGWLGWLNDYPDGDLNLSCRLQLLTSMKVNPDGRVVKLSDPALFDYPFLFMSHPEAMLLSDEDAAVLRRYLLNGGALMADDLWGERSWETFEFQMKRILPGQGWVELPMEHPLFHCVFDLHGPKNNLQVPTMQLWRRAYNPEDPQSFPSAFRGDGSREMHVRVWLDDRQRIMVIALHNTDTGDGWEREGENEIYFHQFSETRAYPLAVNAIYYLMTH